MIEVTDKTLMPFGKYKGTALANVPAGYLIYIYENMNLHDNLKTYIKKNMDVLKAEVARIRKNNAR
ncbi:MAG TPA: DUF3820 family protein [Puia sp.]|nr:DUF3820 family protein [Puia sp.]